MNKPLKKGITIAEFLYLVDPEYNWIGQAKTHTIELILDSLPDYIYETLSTDRENWENWEDDLINLMQSEFKHLILIQEETTDVDICKGIMYQDVIFYDKQEGHYYKFDWGRSDYLWPEDCYNSVKWRGAVIPTIEPVTIYIPYESK